MLIAVGDVHGQLDHFDALLAIIMAEVDKARARGVASEVVLVGDYVDRGPQSLGALRRVIDLQTSLGIPVHALRGNHDHYLIDFLLSERPDAASLAAWCDNGGGTTLAELGVRQGDVLNRDPIELARRARATAGPEVLGLLQRLQLQCSFGRYVFAHAGVHPKLPLAEHGARELLWVREPFLSGRDWRQPFTVVHGHTIRGPEVLAHRIAVDSGAYRTGVLTAVLLDGDRVRFLCVSNEPKLKALKRLPGYAHKRRFMAAERLPSIKLARPLAA